MRTLALGLILVGLAACGGHGTSFADRADAICTQQEQAIRALPAPTGVHGFTRVFERRVRLARAEADGLRRLEPPEGKAKDLRGLVAQIEAQIEAAERLRIASITGDVESAEGADFQGKQAVRRAKRHALKLGLAVCGNPSAPAN